MLCGVLSWLVARVVVGKVVLVLVAVVVVVVVVDTVDRGSSLADGQLTGLTMHTIHRNLLSPLNLIFDNPANLTANLSSPEYAAYLLGETHYILTLYRVGEYGEDYIR